MYKYGWIYVDIHDAHMCLHINTRINSFNERKARALTYMYSHSCNILELMHVHVWIHTRPHACFHMYMYMHASPCLDSFIHTIPPHAFICACMHACLDS